MTYIKQYYKIILTSMHFYFFYTYNFIMKNGGAFMFSSLCINGFLQFLQTAVFTVGYISGVQLFPEPLSSEEERICLEKLSTGDEEARNLLIERNLRLVAHVCKKYSNSNVDQEDLISIGTIGLIKGINSFKPEKGARLSTYVSRCIDNEILMHFRATKKLNNEVYLNEPIGKDKDDNVVTLQEVLENDERSVEESVDLKMKVRLLYEKMKNLLKDRERTILELRFGLDGHKPKTQIEIAEQIGISRSYVSRIETKAIKKLAKEIRD